MKFIVIDLILFFCFLIFVIFFLIKNKKKISREGILFLYRTNYGIKLIKKFSKKNQKLLNILSFISIIFGYVFLISSIIFLFISLRLSIFAKYLPKTPPIIPIIPYATHIFKIDFLPPLYFTYWIIIILTVAIFHEFAHGIFSNFYKIKIKSTGFGFLGPFIAAFVEPDEKEMEKKEIKKQLAILSAGSFANFLIAIIFIILLQIFFLAFYTPVGFAGYFFYVEKVNLSDINLDINKTNLSFPLKFKIENKNYYLDKDLWEIQKDFIEKNKTKEIYLYLETPAYKNNLSGAIIEIDGKKIRTPQDIEKVLSEKKPGEIVKIKTEEKEYNIELGENPKNSSRGFLGISIIKLPSISKLFSFSFYSFNPYIKIKPKSQAFDFLKDLIYWIIIINISVAIFNMLPFLFLDGGKVSYLTFLSFFKNKKKAMLAYNVFSFIMIFILILIFLFWVLR